MVEWSTMMVSKINANKIGLLFILYVYRKYSQNYVQYDFIFLTANHYLISTPLGPVSSITKWIGFPDGKSGEKSIVAVLKRVSGCIFLTAIEKESKIDFRSIIGIIVTVAG